MSLLQTCTVLLLLLKLALCSNPISTSAPRQALDGCRDRCGAVAVPYPFGIGDGCFFDPRFDIRCDDSASPAPKAYLGKRLLNVTEISLLDGELQVLQNVAVDCYEANGARGYSSGGAGILTLPTAYTASVTKNKFTAIGCDTSAIIQAYRRDGTKYTTGCMSLCDRLGDIDFGSCSGVGCCQVAAIPARLVNISVSLESFSNHSKVFGFNPCSYAILAEESEFRFTNASFQEFRVAAAEFPFILDWKIGDSSCEVARASEDYACKGNSLCVESKTGDGYLCQCSLGFVGNPYHPNGCQDVDECKDKNPCVNGKCTNTNGSFDCTCEEGYTKFNNTCIKENKSRGPAIPLLVYVPLSVSIGVLAVVFLGSMLWWGHRKRKLIRQKEKFFEQNGGLMLQQRLSSDQKGYFETAKIFTEEELIRATNNYQHVVGEGGYGLVYKGILPDNKVVAIKKPKIGAQTQTKQQSEQFINEVILLMQINHRNVVRLLGCCLETEVPILVYEFIKNGTLFEHIHKKDSKERPSLSWEQRLKIAVDTAGALAYLHSETNTPILHRDIKTMNILLDENYTAKVSDFGTSRLVPLDQDELSTLVQGTIGYLDPEYLQSSQLTEKSDVYSFGVVLAELITGKKALSFDKSEGITNNLAMSFLSLEDDDHLLRIIDENIVDEVSMEEIKKVANLTKRCLKINGVERPMMKEVAMKLEGLRGMSNHPWGKADHFRTDETAYLLGSPPIDSGHNHDLECSSSNISVVYDNVNSQ